MTISSTEVLTGEADDEAFGSITDPCIEGKVHRFSIVEFSGFLRGGLSLHEAFVVGLEQNFVGLCPAHIQEVSVPEMEIPKLVGEKNIETGRSCEGQEHFSMKMVIRRKAQSREKKMERGGRQRERESVHRLKHLLIKSIDV